MLISGNARAHEDDRLEKADEIIHKSAVLLQKNATDKALAGEVAGVWVNSQTSSNQQTGGTRVVASNFLLIVGNL